MAENDFDFIKNPAERARIDFQYAIGMRAVNGFMPKDDRLGILSIFSELIMSGSNLVYDVTTTRHHRFLRADRTRKIKVRGVITPDMV